MQSERNGKISALTGFRWLAATFVFIYHNRKYWRTTLPDPIDHLLSEFHIGVSLFFILSGFLITSSYGTDPLQSKKEYAKYLLQRLARIYPMYWLILLCFTLDPSFGGGHFNALLFTLGHGFSNQLNLNGIAQAWSLTVEMSYYLLAPVITKLIIKGWRQILALGVTLAASFFLIGIIWKAINGNPRSFFTPPLFLIDGTLAGQLLFFVAGAIVFLYPNFLSFVKIPIKKTWLGTLGILATISLSALFHNNLYDQANLHIAGTGFQLIFISFCGMCWIQGLIEETTIQSKIFGSSLFVLLGNASFIFYLIHIAYVNQKIKEYILLPDRNYLLLWGVSCLLYLLIEKPLYRFCRNQIKKW